MATLLEMRSITPLLLVAVVSGGCGGDDDDSCTVPEPTLASIHAVVMDPSCGLSGSCHNDSKGNPEPIFDGTRDDGSFDVTEVEVICQYIDAPAVSDEQNRPLITSGSCADSYLMVKIDPARESEITSSTDLLDAQNGAHASGMPQRSKGVTGTALCQAKIDAVCAWITAGTPGCP